MLQYKQYGMRVSMFLFSFASLKQNSLDIERDFSLFDWVVCTSSDSGQEKMAINLALIPEIQWEKLCWESLCINKMCLQDFIKLPPMKISALNHSNRNQSPILHLSHPLPLPDLCPPARLWSCPCGNLTAIELNCWFYPNWCTFWEMGIMWDYMSTERDVMLSNSTRCCGDHEVTCGDSAQCSLFIPKDGQRAGGGQEGGGHLSRWTCRAERDSEGNGGSASQEHYKDFATDYGRD